MIYIPSSFTYSKIPAVISVPGTAILAGGNFGPNIGKEFQGLDYADPVYLNIPDKQLADLKVGRVCSKRCQLHLRNLKQQKRLCIFLVGRFVHLTMGNDLLAFHPVCHFGLHPYQWGFGGAGIAYFLCPGFPKILCAPAILQNIILHSSQR